MPVLVNEQRKKLSKRRDKVALEQYRDEGYLAEAMVNYLMTLGWTPPGDSEIVDWATIEAAFRLEDVTHSPAFFDVKKLDAFNGDYIRAMPLDAFIERAQREIPADWDRDRFAAIAPYIQERLVTFGEVPGKVDFLFWPTDAPIEYDEAVVGEGVRRADGRGRCSTISIAEFRRRGVDGRRAEGDHRAASWFASTSSSARRRPRRGSRSPAGRSVHRCSSRSKCSDATRRCAGSAWPRTVPQR